MTEVYPHGYDQLLDEAATWIARLRAPDASSADQHAFSQWLNTSDQHSKAFDEMADTWESLGTAAHIPELTSELQAAQQRSQRKTSARAKWQWASWQSGLAMACIAGLFTLFTVLSGPIVAPAETYITAAGQQRTITLSDGSVIELNTKSSLTVNFSEAQRSLTLNQGEAYFDVASDKQRPFVVDIGQGSVTAVGTAFNIHRHKAQAQVVVTEGIVQMREHMDPTTPSPNSERLSAQQQAAFGKHGLSAVSHADPQKTLAWRAQTLIFDQVPLADALQELNRYLDEPVDSSDPSLLDLKVSGTFSVKAPTDTLQAFKTSFNLTSEPQSPSRLYRSAQ